MEYKEGGPMQSDLTDLYAKSPETKNLTEKQMKVFNASIRLFSLKGYANTSTKEIADFAEVSEGSIFKHFTNKHGLLNAILKPLIDSLLPDVLHEFSRKTLLTSYPSLQEFVNTIIKDRIQFIKKNILVVKIFLSEILYDSSIRNDLFKAFPKEFIEDLNNEISQMKERKILVDWPNDQIVRFLAANLAGYVVQHYIYFPKQQWDEDAEVEHLIDFIVKGLTPDKS
ncbi:transcriptional regulator, TetR family [Lentilactobacillus rapi DSM 19907 = JCM 15042]|nr:transcriptional regulator, TetR family [Lentilactobacillus rapi DSM 19907 = JCM 15042]